ncbi:MAG: type VI secretion system baseplate subunit TssE [Nitrincola lacisaponensis]|uniref:type VI secretion system baseplate subunit TssE n=1 Tax=Nitrincola lacisaponensis TaxID=267850 RepID=UPI00391A978B
MSATFLNRFLDDQPDFSEDQPVSPRIQTRLYMESVLADLEKVLNSKMNVDFYQQVAFDTLLSFGVVDFSSVNVASKESVEQLRLILLKTLRANEPRFSDVKVSIKETTQTRAQIAFQVDAVLSLHESAELVMFNAAFVPTVRRFRISE